MRTIDKFLEYKLTHEERKALYECGICNGLGGKGVNLEKLIKDNLEQLPYFDKNKASKLLQDFILLSEIHDIQFRFQLGFYKSNYKFAYRVYKLLYKFKLLHRLSFALIIFILLQKVGKRYYTQ